MAAFYAHIPALPAPGGASPAPFLKWAGGKTQLLAQYRPLFPRGYQRYYEPFLGGGAVFFALRPRAATLNDANATLIAAYRHIQQQVEPLLALLHALRCAYHALPAAQQKAHYYDLRARYNDLTAGDLEKTALLIFLNKTCYNGLYRENRRGKFNVPFGIYKNPPLFGDDNLRAVARALRGARLLTTDFASAVADARSGDFVYFDPPYMPRSTTASFTSYTGRGFGAQQQAELAEVARWLARRGAAVMLSNSDTPLIRDLYRGFWQHEVLASRAINSNPARRGKIGELLITSYICG